MKLKSDFALLDVMHGRKQLAKKMPSGSQRLPTEHQIPVVITGRITHRHGGDDGISIEFGVEVDHVEVGTCPALKEPSFPSKPSSKPGRVQAGAASAAAGLKFSARRNITTASKRLSVETRASTTAKSSIPSVTAKLHQKKPSPPSRGRKGLKKSA